MKQYFFPLQNTFRKICFQSYGIAHRTDTNKKISSVPHKTRRVS